MIKTGKAKATAQKRQVSVRMDDELMRVVDRRRTSIQRSQAWMFTQGLVKLLGDALEPELRDRIEVDDEE